MIANPHGMVEPSAPGMHPCAPTSTRAWRAWRALRTRGARYVWHKTLRRLPGLDPLRRRQWLYADPRAYWTLRGGDEYFSEQEGQPARTDRIIWIADRIASRQPRSVLEVGCGYGKVLRLLRERLGPDVPLVGVDFSASQLEVARRHLAGLSGITLAHASGARLPFLDDAFDLVLTSAVILHNPPVVADAIRREVVRVSSRLAAHSEDTDVSYNRFGYDTAAWYRDRALPVLESGPIPCGDAAARAASQFCVAGPWRA